MFLRSADFAAAAVVAGLRRGGDQLPRRGHVEARGAWQFGQQRLEHKHETERDRAHQHQREHRAAVPFFHERMHLAVARQQEPKADAANGDQRDADEEDDDEDVLELPQEEAPRRDAARGQPTRPPTIRVSAARP